MSNLEDVEKYLQLFQGGNMDTLKDAWNNFLKIASIIQLQGIVRQFNLHTAIPKYTKMTKEELVGELIKRIGIEKGKLVYKKIAPINLKDKLKNITIYLTNIKKLYLKDKIMFEEQRKILKKNKRKLQKEIITPKLNELLNEILAYPKYKAPKNKVVKPKAVKKTRKTIEIKPTDMFEYEYEDEPEEPMLDYDDEELNAFDYDYNEKPKKRKLKIVDKVEPTENVKIERQPFIVRQGDNFDKRDLVVNDWNTATLPTALLQFDRKLYDSLEKWFNAKSLKRQKENEEGSYIDGDMVSFILQTDLLTLTPYYNNKVIDKYGVKVLIDGINKIAKNFVEEYGNLQFVENIGDQPNISIPKSAKISAKNMKLIQDYNNKLYNNEPIGGSYNKSVVERIVRDNFKKLYGNYQDIFTDEEIMKVVNSEFDRLTNNEKQSKSSKKQPKMNVPKSKGRVGIKQALMKMTKPELRTIAKHYNRDIPISKYTRMGKEDLITELSQLIEVIDDKIFTIDTPSYSGKGFLDYFRNILDKNRYNLSTSSILKKYGNHKVMVLQINRTPIYNSINKALNLISLGKWNKVRKEFSYDTLYHLALVATILMDDGTYKRILIEKNQQININDKPKMYDTTEFITIPVSTLDLTINNMLDNTIDKIGKDHFYTYDAFSWNCQDFIKSILMSNNLYNNRLNNFVYQELTDLVNNLPSYVPITSRLITDLASLIDRLRGAGY